MKLDLWRPLLDVEREWDSVFPMLRLIGERDDFPLRPSMDVDRTDGELIVSAELPGIDPEKDIEIILDDDFLTIKGEKSETKEVSEDEIYRRERRYGKFERRIEIPEGVSADRVTADYAKGVLTVTVMLPEETKPAEPRRIPVSSNAS